MCGANDCKPFCEHQRLESKQAADAVPRITMYLIFSSHEQFLAADKVIKIDKCVLLDFLLGSLSSHNRWNCSCNEFMNDSVHLPDASFCIRRRTLFYFAVRSDALINYSIGFFSYVRGAQCEYLLQNNFNFLNLRLDAICLKWAENCLFNANA